MLMEYIIRNRKIIETLPSTKESTIKVNIDKTIKALSWKPKIKIVNGLKKIINLKH